MSRIPEKRELLFWEKGTFDFQTIHKSRKKEKKKENQKEKNKNKNKIKIK